MPTLSEITHGHSQRISRIAQVRDARLREVTDARDRDLRALPKAAKLYEAFDRQMEEARDKQSAVDAKAESARAAALQDASDALSEALAAAHQVRRDADVAAFEKRRKADEAAEHEFNLAIGAAASSPTSKDAQRVRAEKLAKAKQEFDAALAAALEQFRKSRDAALVAESRDSRDAGRAFAEATRVSESSLKAARATAEQGLAKALAALPEAEAEFAEWRTETAAIVADFRRAENEEFERFHGEVQALKA